MDLKPILEPLAFVLGIASLSVTISALLQSLERSRRELASTLIYNWANHLDWPTSRALALLPRLERTVVNNIDAKSPTRLPAELYEAIVSILAAEFSKRELPKPPDASADAFAITAEQSAHIRFLWVRWLNRLEGTLAAWQQGAADADIMSQEFEPLIRGRQAELEALKDVRNGLPVIETFCLAAMKEGPMKIRPKLGIFPWRR